MPEYRYQYRREQRVDFTIIADDEEASAPLAAAHAEKFDLSSADDESDDPGELELLDDTVTDLVAPLLSGGEGLAYGDFGGSLATVLGGTAIGKTVLAQLQKPSNGDARAWAPEQSLLDNWEDKWPLLRQPWSPT